MRERTHFILIVFMRGGLLTTTSSKLKWDEQLSTSSSFPKNDHCHDSTSAVLFTIMNPLNPKREQKTLS